MKLLDRLFRRQVSEFDAGRDDFPAEIERLRRKYANVPKREIDEVNSLLRRSASCGSSKQQNTIHSLIQQERNVPALIAIALRAGPIELQGDWAVVALGRMHPRNPDAYIVLALISEADDIPGMVSENAMPALVSLGASTAPATPYLAALLKSGNNDAALCLALIGPPALLSEQIVGSLAHQILEPTRDWQLKQWYKKDYAALAFESLLGLGDAAKQTLLNLLRDNRLNKDQTEKVLARFDVQDPIAADLALLRSGSDQEKLDAVARLEQSCDSRAKSAIEGMAGELAQIRLRMQPPQEQLQQAMNDLPIGDPDAVQRALHGVARKWGVPDSHRFRGNLQEICQVVVDEFATHQKQGEGLVYLMRHADGMPQGVMAYQVGRGGHFIGRLGPDDFGFLIHKKYYECDLPQICRTGTKSHERTSPDMIQEPWRKYGEFVNVPKDSSDSELRTNMRFQFMFSGSAEADRIISSLPENLRSALHTPQHEGLAPPGAGPDVEGKYTVWYEDVSFTIGEAKDLMNRVVRAGGGIYEAFLT